MKQRLYLFLVVIVLCVSLALSTEEALPWQLVRDEDGVQLFTAEVGSTGIKKVKAMTVVDAGIDKLIAVLNDVQRYPVWVPYLQEARVLEQYSDNEFLAYDLFAAPWPARDRDYVYRVVIDRQPNRVVYYMRSEESELMAEQTYAVRALIIESRYVLTAINDKQTSIELILHTDPRGQLPLWIVNIVHKALPFDALTGLRRQVAAGTQE